MTGLAGKPVCVGGGGVATGPTAVGRSLLPRILLSALFTNVRHLPPLLQLLLLPAGRFWLHPPILLKPAPPTHTGLPCFARAGAVCE